VQVELDRFDLFHAHLFLTAENSIGLLFHAKEFPAECNEFPYNLGFCQRSSPMTFDQSAMDWRNYLYYKVRLHEASRRRQLFHRIIKPVTCRKVLNNLIS
jgi:hypothetical protein